MSYERPYYKDIDYRPQLFYAAFGVGDTELEVSKVRHKVDGFPEGLSMTAYEKPEHAEYMEALIGGDLGEMLRDRTPQLYEAVCGTDKFTVIRGQVKDDGDLCYFRNVIGFIEAMVEEGALGILDVFTTTLFSPSEWTKNIFEPHALML